MDRKWLVVAVVAGAACTGGAGDVVGGALVEAGALMVDAGEGLRDAMGTQDARAAADGEAGAVVGDAAGGEGGGEGSALQDPLARAFVPRIVLRDADMTPVEALVTFATPGSVAAAESTDALECVRVMVFGQDIRASVHRLADGAACDDTQPYIAGRLDRPPYTLAVEYE